MCVASGTAALPVGEELERTVQAALAQQSSRLPSLLALRMAHRLHPACTTAATCDDASTESSCSLEQEQEHGGNSPRPRRPIGGLMLAALVAVAAVAASRFFYAPMPG